MKKSGRMTTSTSAAFRDHKTPEASSLSTLRVCRRASCPRPTSLDDSLRGGAELRCEKAPGAVPQVNAFWGKIGASLSNRLEGETEIS